MQPAYTEAACGIFSLVSVNAYTRLGMLQLGWPTISRYVNFMRSLLSSPKYVVRVLASVCLTDYRTVMGRTLEKLSCLCGRPVSALTASAVKRSVSYFAIPSGEEWRIPMLQELLSPEVDIPGFPAEELKELKEFLCTS